MILTSPLQTAHLSLCTLNPDMVDDRYVEWLNDPDVNRYLEVRLDRQDLAKVRDFVRSVNESDSSLLLGIFAMDRGPTGWHIGNIKLGPILWSHGRGEIGLVVGERSQWGKGYATEAIRAVTEYAHDALGLIKVTAGLYAANQGSAKAFLKAGFTQEAVLKSHWSSGEGRDDGLMFAHFAKAP